ncbi:hypothetical protein GE061_012791 [Apolygus lucorum]|uniref:Cathepsin propeptide inhibitor domain-containing protein n=1 Tax=Apolygus lucorum TaxID=248454 RepID=A0A8S9XTB0_APOLU|nr:hypothetical protein GE061_012791 [Apolygus lucorum]
MVRVLIPLLAWSVVLVSTRKHPVSNILDTLTRVEKFLDRPIQSILERIHFPVKRTLFELHRFSYVFRSLRAIYKFSKDTISLIRTFLSIFIDDGSKYTSPAITSTPIPQARTTIQLQFSGRNRIMRWFLAVSCLLALATAFPKTEISSAEWLAFKAQHGKMYGSQEEEAKRLEIYLENKRMVEDHNSKFEKGEVSYQLALNQFADLRTNELRRGGKLRRPAASMNAPVHVNSNQPLPPTVDWRTTPGVVSDPGYIQMCESSWAFSAIGSMTGQLAIKKGLHFEPLSHQNLIDCTFDLGNSGCEGGWVDIAFKYIQQNGIDSDDYYWYLGDDSNCKFNQSFVVPGATVTGYVDIKAGSEDDLMDAVANVGPISVTVGAYDNAFMTYAGGELEFDHNNTTN